MIDRSPPMTTTAGMAPSARLSRDRHRSPAGPARKCADVEPRDVPAEIVCPPAPPSKMLSSGDVGPVEVPTGDRCPLVAVFANELGMSEWLFASARTAV